MVLPGLFCSVRQTRHRQRIAAEIHNSHLPYETSVLISLQSVYRVETSGPETACPVAAD